MMTPHLTILPKGAGQKFDAVIMKCETCLNCIYQDGDGSPGFDPNAICQAGHFECHPADIQDPGECPDYSIDFQYTWNAPLIVHYRRTKFGRIEVSDLTECNGLLPDIDIVNAVIRQCEKSKREVSQKERDLQQSLFWAEFDKPAPAAPKKKAAPRKGFVYVMKDTIRGFYKIGFTKSLDNRFATLKTANPAIEMIAHHKGSQDDERKLHKLFDNLQKRVDREWFELTEIDLDVITEYFTCETEKP